MLLLYLLQAIQYQIVQVNQTEPCFNNFTAGINIFRNCGLGVDYLESALLGWEWITGGNFSIVIVSLFVVVSYLKYKKVVYPMMIGVLFLPISYFAFPDSFLIFAILMTGVTIGILVWYAFVKQTKEY